MPLLLAKIAWMLPLVLENRIFNGLQRLLGDQASLFLSHHDS